MPTAAEEIVARKRAALEALDPTKVVAPYDAAIAAIQSGGQAQVSAGSADALRRGAGDAATAAVSEIIGRGNAARLDALNRNRIMAEFHGALSRDLNRTYFDRTAADLPAYQRAFDEDRRGGGGFRGGRGRGGGGGGGGSGGDFPDAYWVNEWELGGPRGSLYDLFGSESTGKGAARRFIKGEAALGQRHSAPGWARRQAIAAEFGILPETQEGWFATTPFGREAKKGLEAAKQGADPRAVVRRLSQAARGTGEFRGRGVAKQQRPTVVWVAEQLGVQAPKRGRRRRRRGRR